MNNFNIIKIFLTFSMLTSIHFFGIQQASADGEVSVDEMGVVSGEFIEESENQRVEEPLQGEEALVSQNQESMEKNAPQQESETPKTSTSHAKATILIENADKKTITAATGHYSRARSLLISALKEYDRGVKRADPSSIVNSKKVRNSIIYSARELERLIAPRARKSESGIQYSEEPGLLNEAYR